MIRLTPAMIEDMLSEPDLEGAMNATAADMVESGWPYQEAMTAIAVAFGNVIREERATQRQVRAVLEEYVLPEAFLR